MKKILLSTIALLFALILNAQITLTSADLPSVGDAFISVIDSNSISADTLTPGANGANLSWDFSNLQNTNYDTVLFIDPASTPYAADFPSANLVQKTRGSYSFLNKTSSILEAVGVLFDTLKINFSDNLTFFQLPTNYGDNFTDDAMFSTKMRYDTTVTVNGFPITIDSVRLKRNITYTRDVTGWGSLTTPTSTYNDILKTKAHEIDIDSLWMHSTTLGWVPVQNSKDSTDTYEWFTNGIGYSLLTLEYKHDTLTNAEYFYATTVGIKNNTISSTNITVYPNPVKDIINFSSNNKINSIEIFDITGKTVIVKNKIDKNITQINVSNLDNGIYFYKIIDVNGNIKTKKIIKE